MEIKKLEAAIEAILFTMGESVELSQIADAIQQDKETTRKIIQNMMDKYQKKDGVIMVGATKIIFIFITQLLNMGGIILSMK